MGLRCCYCYTIRKDTTNTLCAIMFVALNADHHLFGNVFWINFTTIVRLLSHNNNSCSRSRPGGSFVPQRWPAQARLAHSPGKSVICTVACPEALGLAWLSSTPKQCRKRTSEMPNKPNTHLKHLQSASSVSRQMIAAILCAIIINAITAPCRF